MYPYIKGTHIPIELEGHTDEFRAAAGIWELAEATYHLAKSHHMIADRYLDEIGGMLVRINGALGGLLEVADRLLGEDEEYEA